MNEIAVG